MSKDIPAFPSNKAIGAGEIIHTGMTLRDYFAAKAMQALIGNSDPYSLIDIPYAYTIADAMLEARKS